MVFGACVHLFATRPSVSSRIGPLPAAAGGEEPTAMSGPHPGGTLASNLACNMTASMARLRAFLDTNASLAGLGPTMTRSIFWCSKSKLKGSTMSRSWCEALSSRWEGVARLARGGSSCLLTWTPFDLPYHSPNLFKLIIIDIYHHHSQLGALPLGEGGGAKHSPTGPHWEFI